MQKIKRLIKNKNFLRGLFAVILIANFGLISELSANGFPEPPSRLNLGGIMSAEENPFCPTSVFTGIAGSVVDLGNDFVSGYSYSEYIAATENLCPEVVTTAGLQKKLESNPGILNVANSLNNTLLAQRPASGLNYIQEKVYALTNPTTVSAQSTEYYSPGGTGFDLLRPIQAFWSWSVRVVYGVLILLIIAMAFGIMFKSKLPVIGEITIQNAIPAITLAMILVPLSYAISGVFIDVITVGTNAVHQFLIGTPASPGYSIYQNSVNDTGSGGGGTQGGYFPDDPRVSFMYIRDRINVKEPLTAVFNSTIQNDTTGLVNNGLLTSINTIINSIFHSNPNAPDQSKDMTWLGDILQLIVALASIWISIKIFVKLFKKYITMILSPILSPFIFATVAIPGNGIKSVMDYVKMLWSCALAYIVTYLMFLLTVIFTDPSFQAGVPPIASGFFRPPLLNLGGIGVDSGNITLTLFTLIGLGIFFSIPSTLESIDVALGTTGMIPKFITTPIDSFKDGLSFATKSTVNLGRNTDSLVRGIHDKRIATNAAMRNARIRAMNFADRRRGIKADDSDSWQSKKSREYNEKITELTQRMEAAEAAGDRRARNNLAREIEDVKKEAQALGVSTFGVSEEKKEDGKSINVTVEWNGNPTFANFEPGPNRITFNDAQISRIRELVVTRREAIIMETLFKLKIEFQNIPIPDRFEPGQLEISTEGPVVNRVQTYIRNPEGYSLGDINRINSPATTRNFIPFPFVRRPVATDNIYEHIRFTTSHIDAPKLMQNLTVLEGSKAIKLPFILQIDPMDEAKFEELFGRYDPTTNSYGVGLVQRGLISEKRGFTYGTTTSNMITMIVGVSAVK